MDDNPGSIIFLWCINPSMTTPTYSVLQISMVRNSIQLQHLIVTPVVLQSRSLSQRYHNLIVSVITQFSAWFLSWFLYIFNISKKINALPYFFPGKIVPSHTYVESSGVHNAVHGPHTIYRHRWRRLNTSYEKWGNYSFGRSTKNTLEQYILITIHFRIFKIQHYPQ